MPTSTDRPALRFLAKTAGVLALTAAAGVAALTAAAVLSPWPSALLIRRAFTKGGWATNDALAPLVPDGVSSVLNIAYRQDDADALLDIHRPAPVAGGRQSVPAVVWIHGGGWVAGSKDETANYLRILAAEGFVVIAVDYTLAPRGRYPLPLEQVRDALSYLAEHAIEFNLDLTRVVIAGDSAGSQIAAQTALAIADPHYAQRIGITPPLPAINLKAAILHCGAYDLAGAGRSSGAAAWFQKTVLWAYSGTKNFLDDPRFEAASVIDFVTPAFPPTFLSGGNADPLTPQGKAFATVLREQGVAVTAEFAAEDHVPPLNHEYQFDLNSPDGAATSAAALAFLRQYTGNSSN